MLENRIRLSTRLLLLLASLAIAQTPSADEAAIRELERQWDAANLSGDATALETIFADRFILTAEDGTVRTKAEVIGALKAGNIKYDVARTEELNIILHGDAAVVSGKWRGAYSYKDKRVNLLERFTNFYVRRGGRWQCVAGHGSAIR